MRVRWSPGHTDLIPQTYRKGIPFVVQTGGKRNDADSTR